MADISSIKLPNGTTYNIKDSTARSAIPTKVSQLTNDKNFYSEPTYGIGTADPITRPLVESVRANRLAFLPASQIIIEQTTDGGITWTDAGVSDSTKEGLFAGTRPTVTLPLLNGVRSTNCGLRVTITAMRYNVPSGTAETAKYNYWNSTYVDSTERYCSIDKFWFWIGANGDRERITVESATGANPNNWRTKFNTDFGASGWSGSDWVKTSYGSFGGGTNQTGNEWNWRITFFSRMADGASAFTQTSKQAICQIMAYGENVWTSSNNLMKTDRLYAYDVNQNATFPAKVTATTFSGSATLTGTPTAPTASAGTNNTQIATTAFVKSETGNTIPYIVGTQTASTNIWTGVAPFSSLETGQSIRYKLPYEGTSSAAKLNLTLSNNTTTGNISIYMSGSYTVKDQYGAGSVIEMTYDGAAWRVSTITTAIRSVTTSISTTSTGASKFLNNNYITGGSGGSAIISSVLTTIPASDWTGSSPPYVYNSGALGGFTTQSFIFMDLIPSSTYSQAKLEVAEYSKIYKAECTSQSHITFYATSAPSVDLPIQIIYL